MLSDSLPDRRGTCKRLTYILRRAKIIWATSGDSQTVCNSARQSLSPLKTVWKSPAGVRTVLAPSKTVFESLQMPHRSGNLSGSLRLVPGQSWHRRRLSESLLQVP
ncbi:hypothetical protein DPMN_162862 [Dreissena polymorpha]|uniref:Uncharacterized protein n=1 Tax=Dreissena polymorpha TaxID=45954 RepID=A0A9D4IQU8_DREPO|nr:hypothetical protein DPMN_162862 [Dreissena polymorpha]